MTSEQCTTCGAEFIPEASFCGKCGTPIAQNNSEEIPTNSTITQLRHNVMNYAQAATARLSEFTRNHPNNVMNYAQAATARLSEFAQKHPNPVKLVMAVGSVVVFFLIGIYVLRLSGMALLWLLPIVLGATIPLFKLDQVESLVDRLSNWIVRARERAAPDTGRLRKYCYRPFLGGLSKIKGWTEGIGDGYYRAGVRLASYAYFSLIAVNVFLFAIYAIALIIYAGVIAVIIISMLIVTFWILSKTPGGESTDRNYFPPLTGFKRSKIVKEGFLSDEELYQVDEQGRIKKPGFLFDEPTGYRVDEKGSLYKEGFFFDEKIHEVRDDGTIVDVTGFLPKDTGYRIGKDGKFYKKGFLFDEDTQIKVKPFD